MRPRKKPLFSPLRYPGGKSALYPLLSELTQTLSLNKGTYVEPYAGGAGAALALLITGKVRNILINDLDTSIYCFWKSVVENTNEFSKLVRSTPLTVEEWQRQKGIYRRNDASNALSLGFATFYLNRTNRSGVLNGGVIGGLAQTGQYKIDARFNVDTLLERIRLIGLYSDRISVHNMDGVDLLRQVISLPNHLIYADPPYYDKGKFLYLNAFEDRDHERLADCLNSYLESWWLLTYDQAPFVKNLYGERICAALPLHYSAHRREKAVESLFLSDALATPYAQIAQQNPA